MSIRMKIGWLISWNQWDTMIMIAHHKEEVIHGVFQIHVDVYSKPVVNKGEFYVGCCP